MEFDMPKNQSSIIKVIGVGGGGSNAVNHMYEAGIKGVDFIVCNTDSQALDISPVPIKVQLGQSLTEGRGAGSIPDVGRNAAIENLDDIQEILSHNTHMVFVTAGMGGGTGTGAAPVIAKAAKDLGILTVGIVTIPFTFEGKKRMLQAEEGLREMRASVDTLLVITNDKLREIYGNLSLKNAFSQADGVLSVAAKGIAEIISVTGAINVDMNDVNTVMKDSGVAIMGQGTAREENRALKAAKEALESPLLNDNNIEGAKYILLNITYGENEIMMDEISDITDYIQQAAGSTADVIWGHGNDDSLAEDEVSVTIIATGFKITPDTGFEMDEPVRHILTTDEKKDTPVAKQMDDPMGSSDDVEPYLKEVKTSESEPMMEEKPAEEVQKFNLFEDEPIEESQNEEKEVEETPTVESVEEPQEEKKYYTLDESTNEEEEENLGNRVNAEVVNQVNRERLRNLREMADRLKTPEGLTQLEKEPAYKRRNVRLDNIPHSSDSEVSKYTLAPEEDEDGNKRSGLRPNNPFLHDNVD
ncbi:cell division protein FtsZ [Cryomorphaceae bacterium 1068]|nr:cell division protein FtsZ [Cryomorphaceae bacterium 1068]